MAHAALHHQLVLRFLSAPSFSSTFFSGMRIYGMYRSWNSKEIHFNIGTQLHQIINFLKSHGNLEILTYCEQFNYGIQFCTFQDEYNCCRIYRIQSLEFSLLVYSHIHKEQREGLIKHCQVIASLYLWTANCGHSQFALCSFLDFLRPHWDTYLAIAPTPLFIISCWL